METTIKYPIIETDDWFSVKRARKEKIKRIKDFRMLKYYITELKRKYKMENRFFRLDDLIGTEAQLIPDIDTHRTEYLEKRAKKRANQRRRSRIGGMSDALNEDILKFRYDTFIIKDLYKKWVYVKPVNGGDTYKLYYDEVLIKKQKEESK